MDPQEELSTTVFIPTWRRAAWLDKCIRSVLEQNPLPSEIVVAVREEDEEAGTLVREWISRSPIPLRLVDPGGPGQAQAVAAGLAATTSEIFVEIDDDVEVVDGWMAGLIAPFADPAVACVGGRMLVEVPARRVPRDAGCLRWYGKVVSNVSQLPADSPKAVDGVQECNWAWRTQVLRTIEFDPVLQFDAQAMWGLDLTLQVKESGWRVIYQPAAKVRDREAPRDPSFTRADRPARIYAHSRNYTYIMLKHLHGLRRLPFFVWWWGMGEPGSYGVIKAVVDLFRRGKVVRIETASAFKGRAEGVKLWRKGKR
ncbi:MAG: glycosyltransferase [Actinomycetota bacterium]